MSSDSGEEFNMSASEVSDEYSDDSCQPRFPVTKAKSTTKPSVTSSSSKATTKLKTGKASGQRGPGNKKKPLKAVENVTDDESESGGGSDSESSIVVSEPKSTLPKKNDNVDASEMYQKMTPVEHILKRPDSYIGSVETRVENMWVFNKSTKKLEFRQICYVPGFYKIFDEIIVNAADNKINDPTMNAIKITIDLDDPAAPEISVWNNGCGIPIEMHKKEKVWIPSMIFGQLLTSSHYDDNEKRLTGGRNGYGAKLTNIYSTTFTVETADKQTGQKFKQTWKSNMSKEGDAKITSNPKGEEYTKVTFKPDLKRFGMAGIDEDTEALLLKRVYDLAGTVDGIAVTLNKEKIKVKDFKSYVGMYVAAAAEAVVGGSDGGAPLKPTIVYEQTPRWEYAFVLSDSGAFQQVSFVNSIATTKGGTHVHLIADQICKKLLIDIEKKNKAAKVKAQQIKNHMWIFVKALVENPTFDSQTKESLTLTANKFGSKPSVTDEFIKKVAKSEIIMRVLNWAKFKADQMLAKTDGTKRTRMTGMAKLSDANNAGGKRSDQCTLILTEGDSAKALAEAGLGVPLNISKNAELQNIKKIMGLQHAKKYDNVKSLRYGSLMIMTDQDHDGSHIKGLLINFFDHYYPSLLKVPSFLVEFVTPIVRVTKGKEKRNFFTIPEYLEWNEKHNKDGKWSAKYYKGLGTSTNEDAKEYFSNMATHMIPFATLKDPERELIDMAFNKTKAENRKEWLRKFKPGTYIDHNVDEITYDDFINQELIQYSVADNTRSIPSVVDGLKPSQRKILFGCFKRKLKEQIKVAQLVGYISEKTAYHHGEQSLATSIIGLAQDFVGSNNVNLLSPDGQYGTRFNGGKDAASPRYIFTHLPPITRAMFHARDDPLLNYLVDDGDPVEPEWYVPVVPNVLINGAEGIGTGWSTSIPSYNPYDIVANIRRLMRDEPQVPMVPWFRGFKGTMTGGDGKFTVTGVINQISDTSVEITELPIHRWTEGYKEFLESCMVSGEGKTKAGKVQERFVQDYTEHHAGGHVHFIINMTAHHLKEMEADLVSRFKLSTTVNTSNMVCFDPDGSLKKYASPEEILDEFYAVRLQFYQKRKAYTVNELQTQAEKLNNQARFVQMIIDKQLVVSNRKKADIGFPGEGGWGDRGAQDDDDEGSSNNLDNFDYLLGMAIWSLTKEKVEKLKREREAKEAELEAFVKLTPNQLWDADLEEFLRQWQAVLDRDEGLERAAGRSTKGKKQTLKTRKSLGSSKPGKRKDWDDDDFNDGGGRSKAAVKPKAQSAKPNLERMSKPSNDVDLVPDSGATSKQSANVNELSDDELSRVPAKMTSHMKPKSPPKKAPTRSKPATKRKSAEFDAEDQDEDEKYIKRGKKTKVAPKSSITDFFGAVPSEGIDRARTEPNASSFKPLQRKPPFDDEDTAVLSDSLPSPPPAAKRPVRAAASKKKIMSSDSDDGEDSDFQILE
ncbi:DNA topoisomerase [Cantharellus anzutake]|uniref:DNA topoisomerase n=1 Tax=Cantharellus anzutake TaxID=1750568 RepID=UPI0019031104|nr:DNA topoisomerase [Cantharellus anzutake]KAF8338185.1 DNA topoisomerase [Cantharellus anzutake]